VQPLRLAFAGTPDFAARHLEALIASSHEIAAVLTQPDRPAGRGKQPRGSAVKKLALSAQLPLLQPDSLRDDAAVAALAALEVDALIVVAYGLILPRAVLNTPRLGCINVHGSLLPRWRGAAPIQRAIEAGDAESGVTIMLMDAGLDTGPMLATARCPISMQTTSADLYATLATLGPQTLCDVLDDLPAQLAAAQPQDSEQATYASKIRKEEAELDWDSDGAVLARRIHAFNPAPGCYSHLDGERLKIWEALPGPSRGAAAGEIRACGEDGIAVGCAEGELLLTRLQFPGGRALPAAELLRGHPDRLRPGARFRSP
jgi:methionyl-tRNA formyltransferase